MVSAWTKLKTVMSLICPTSTTVSAPGYPVQLVHPLFELHYGVANINQDEGRYLFSQGDPTGAFQCHRQAEHGLYRHEIRLTGEVSLQELQAMASTAIFSMAGTWPLRQPHSLTTRVPITAAPSAHALL